MQGAKAGLQGRHDGDALPGRQDDGLLHDGRRFIDAPGQVGDEVRGDPAGEQQLLGIVTDRLERPDGESGRCGFGGRRGSVH